MIIGPLTDKAKILGWAESHWSIKRILPSPENVSISVGQNRSNKYIKEEGIRMRILRFALIISFVLFCLLNSSGSFGFEAGGSLVQGYMGEYCWQDSDGGIARFAVTKVGNGHYIVNGRHTEASGKVQAMIGNGEVVENQFIMHLTTSSFNAQGISGLFTTAVLDLPGLNGTGESLEVWYEIAGGSTGITYRGPLTLTRISCP